MLEINIENKKFKENVFTHLHITLPQFGLFVIMGPSGCGKTTLLNMIAQLDSNYQGTIKIKDCLLNSKLVKENIEYTSNLLMNDLKVKDYIQYKDPLIDFDMNLKIGILSKGQKQRVSAIYSLNQNKPILLCDEITSGLDEQMAHLLMSRLKEYSFNHLVILCSHDYPLVSKYATSIIDLKSDLSFQYTKKAIIPFKLHYYDKTSQLLLNYKRVQYYFIHVTIFLILLCCILFYFINHSFLDELVSELQAYFPENCYSFSISSEHDLDAFLDSQYVYLVMDDVELLGISTDTNKDLYIDGYTNPIRDLEEGNYPENNNEIVAGSELLEILDQKIGDTLTLHYLINGKDIYIDYKVTGLTSGNEIYFKELGEFYYLKENYNIHCSLGMVVIENQGEFDALIQEREYRYLKVGETYIHQLKKTINKVKVMIYIGCILCLCISFFTLEEILDHSIKEKRKLILYGKVKGMTQKELFLLYFKKYGKIVLITFLLANSISVAFMYAFGYFFNIEILNYLNQNYLIILLILLLIILLMIVSKLYLVVSRK